MSALARFAEYALAFEKAYHSDDWSGVEPFFTEDAVYETTGGPPFDGLHQGRAAVMKAFKASVDGFDRRFDVRKVRMIEGPEDKDGVVWMSWRATYRVRGAADFILEGEERAWFDGGRISRLEDRFAPGMPEALARFMKNYGAKLHPAE